MGEQGGSSKNERERDEDIAQGKVPPEYEREQERGARVSGEEKVAAEKEPSDDGAEVGGVVSGERADVGEGDERGAPRLASEKGSVWGKYTMSRKTNAMRAIAPQANTPARSSAGVFESTMSVTALLFISVA